MKSLQNQYNLIKEGKGNKEIFLKEAKAQFPQYITNVQTFDQAIHSLTEKGIISEAMVLVSANRPETPNWFKVFNENVKANLEETDKEVVEKETAGYDYKAKNNNNISTAEMLTGYYTEMKDPQNAGKTESEIKAIVVKNLEKDPLFYVKNGQFGIKGLGYTEDHPGLGPTKEVTGKYKSSGMEPVKLSEGIHDRDITSASHTNIKTPPKGVGDYDPKQRAASLAKLKNFGPKSKTDKTDESYDYETQADLRGMASEESLAQAIERAKQISDEEGVVQHVNRREDGSYEVSDWYDSDNTVFSYENGRELQEDKVPGSNIKKVGDKWRILSGKTGKMWKAHYDTKEDAEKGLKAYFASQHESLEEDKIALSEAKKRAIEKHIREIEKMGEVAAWEHRIGKIQEKIDELTNKMTVTEGDDVKDMVDKKAVKELKKDIALLEKKKALYEKQKAKAAKKVTDKSTMQSAAGEGVTVMEKKEEEKPHTPPTDPDRDRIFRAMKRDTAPKPKKESWTGMVRELINKKNLKLK